MALYDPTREPDVTPEDAVLVVRAFLQRCARWAEEREIPRRLDELGEVADPGRAAELHAWIAYLRFTEHAIRELEDGTLDGWFGLPEVEPCPG